MDKIISDMHMEVRRLKNLIAELKLVSWENGASWSIGSAAEDLEAAAEMIEQAADLLAVGKKDAV